MKWICLFFFVACMGISTHSYAQLSQAGREKLEKAQDSLKKLTYKMINAPSPQIREKASDTFIPEFVKALQTKYSFDFPFHLLGQISFLYNADSTFRIFTWAIAQSKFHYRFYGAIQMNTKDGHLKLFPLFDDTFNMHNKDTIVGPKNWIGALYYNMVQTKAKNKTYYTLMGWLGYGIGTDQKDLEVLTFKNGKPVFGAPIFNFANDTTKTGIKNRFFLEYKKNGGLTLNYNKNKNMIVYDHLTSIKGDPKNKATLVPDGTYEGFKWENGFWMHVSKVFHRKVKKPPIPLPLKFRKHILGDKGQDKR